MTETTENTELEQAIADAELTEQEADSVRELVERGGIPAAAIAHIVEQRGPDDLQVGSEEDAPAGIPTSEREQMRKLEAEQTRHEETIRTLLGGAGDELETCESCGGLGLTPPNAEPPEHEYFKACPTCRGWSVVKTGSLQPNDATRPCPRCKGRGYLEAMRDGSPLATDQPAGAEPAPLTSATDSPAPEVAPRAEGAGEIEFGTPSWMGDPSIGHP